MDLSRRVAPKLPNEILMAIFKPIGAESTLDLKPLTLVDQRWHNVAASLLLATISISSLRGILDLCTLVNPSPTARRTGGARPSSIIKYARTIVLSGSSWDGVSDYKTADDNLGFPNSYDNVGEEKKALRRLGIYQSPQAISKDIQNLLPHLISLEKLEWYNRFAGDFYLVSQLQQANAIRHIVYGVDTVGCEELHTPYYEHAFSFANLITIAVVSDYPIEHIDLPGPVLQMAKRSPGLQNFSYGCRDDDPWSYEWYIQELFCHSFQDKQLVMWPSLQRLDLEVTQGDLRRDDETIESLTKFLAAHPSLEELILHEMETDTGEPIVECTLSLSSYPDALPRLKKLVGPKCFLACVLESRAACQSVRTVINNSFSPHEYEQWPEDDAFHTERILEALEGAGQTQIAELRLFLTKPDLEVFEALSRSAPRLKSLDLICAPGVGRYQDWITSHPDSDSSSSSDSELGGGDDQPISVADIITSGLEMLPDLEAVGSELAAAHSHLFCDKEQGLLDLGRQFPRLKHIRALANKVQLTYIRSPVGEVAIEIDKDYFMAIQEYPNSRSDWYHRPTSRRALRDIWTSETRVDSRKPSDYVYAKSYR